MMAFVDLVLADISCGLLILGLSNLPSLVHDWNVLDEERFFDLIFEFAFSHVYDGAAILLFHLENNKIKSRTIGIARHVVALEFPMAISKVILEPLKGAIRTSNFVLEKCRFVETLDPDLDD